jgi:hypothetical protein
MSCQNVADIALELESEMKTPELLYYRLIASPKSHLQEASMIQGYLDPRLSLNIPHADVLLVLAHVGLEVSSRYPSHSRMMPLVTQLIG